MLNGGARQKALKRPTRPAAVARYAVSPNLAQLSSDVSDSDVAALEDAKIPMKSPRSIMLGEKLLNSIKHQILLKSVPFLIRQGADLNVQDSDGKTALMYAVMNNDEEIVKMIIESGVDLNVQTRHGLTALMIAVANKKPRNVKLLLDAGADVSIEDKLARSALSFALERGYDRIERMLRDKGAKTTLTPDQISNLQLMWKFMNRNISPRGVTFVSEESDAEESEGDALVKPSIPDDPIHDVILPSELEKQYEPLSILDKRSADDVVDRPPAAKRRRMSSSMFTPSYDMYAGDKYKMQELFAENGWDMTSSSATSTSGPTSDEHVETRKNKRGVRLDPTAPPDLSLWSYPVEQHPSDDDVRAAILDYDYDEIMGGAKKRILEIERATNTRNLRLRRLFNKARI